MSQHEQTAQDTLKQLEHLTTILDYEDAHRKTDLVLCEFLTQLGYSDIVKAWHKVGKYYT